MGKKLKTVITTFLIAAILMTMAACGGGEDVSISTSVLVANSTDVEVVDIALQDVDGTAYDAPRELLHTALAPGEVRLVEFNVPEKQAKESSWVVYSRVAGEPETAELKIGNINPHGDNPLTCLEVYLDGSGKYSPRAYFGGSEADHGIYETTAEGESSYDLSGWIGVYSNDTGSVTLSASDDAANTLVYEYESSSSSASGILKVDSVEPDRYAGNDYYNFSLNENELEVIIVIGGEGFFDDIAGTYIKGGSQGDSSFSGMTEARALEIHEIMSPFYGKYDETDAAAWAGMNASERSIAYTEFSQMIEKLGLSANASESDWIESIDEYIEYYGFFAAAGSSMLRNDDETRLNYFRSVQRYIEGINAGKYFPLHPSILAVADNLTIENWRGQYLLCAGSDHVVLQATKEWTTLDTSFMQSGSVYPQGTTDGDSLNYSLSGSDGKMGNAYFGDADLIPVFRAMGAIADDGAMAHEQIQISAISDFDAPVLYILSEESAEVTRIALMRYNRDEGKYVRDGEIFTASGRCCFNENKEFCYIDTSGTLCIIDANGNIRTAKTDTSSSENTDKTMAYTQTAGDADLSQAPNVIVEPDQPPYNLGGWKVEDTVLFRFDIKSAGRYYVTVNYAKNSADGASIGMEAGNDSSETISGTLPSTGDDWSFYEDYTFPDTLYFNSGGGITFSLRCGRDYGGNNVINLRSVTLTLSEN